MSAQKVSCPNSPFFWDWFRKTLRWPFLLLGGPIACVCEGIARAADTVLPDIHWFIAQCSPATCETEYVDRYGAARGLVRHFRETEDMWRRRVCAAHAWHKLAGRTFGMPKILDHYGYSGSVMFNRALEGEPDLWAHFRVEFGGEYPVSDADYEVILWILNETKPAKSILESLTLVLKPKAMLFVGMAMAAGHIITLEPYKAPGRQTLAPVYVALGRQSWHIVTIKPHATESADA